MSSHSQSGSLRLLVAEDSEADFEILLLVCVSTEEWSRYWLAMAPFALVLGYKDILASKGFRWLFPLFVVLSYVYAWGTLPINTCREDIYAHLMWNLGLWKEFVR